MKKMKLSEIAQPQCQPAAMTIESIMAAAMRAVFLQISQSWTTGFTCRFNEDCTFAKLKFGADKQPKGYGYSVQHSLGKCEGQTTHVCYVSASAGPWLHNRSGIIRGQEFCRVGEGPPMYWDATQAEHISANDAPDSPCH